MSAPVTVTQTVTIPPELRRWPQIGRAREAGLSPAEAVTWWRRVRERIQRDHPDVVWLGAHSVEVLAGDRTAAEILGREVIADAIAAEPWDPGADR